MSVSTPPTRKIAAGADLPSVSRRRERRRRRQWQSSWSRRVALLVGWLSLAAAVAALALFVATSRVDALLGGSGAALVAMLGSWIIPEPAPRRRLVRFAPLEGLRAERRRRRPSLARQLLTLP